MHENLISGFIESATRFPGRTAILLEGKAYSYDHLHRLASGIAGTITGEQQERPALVAVVANRSLPALAGVTGALLAGSGYVPINPLFPPERIRFLLEATGCTTVIAEPSALPAIALAAAATGPGLRVIVPEGDPPSGAAAASPRLTVIGPGQLAAGVVSKAPPLRPGDLAYVMFTSGSTGVPKGVMTTHDNVRWILGVLQERYRITEADRFSLNAEMTFSASVLVIFLALNAGAALCCPTKKELLNPGRFITDNGITVWKCVPSLAGFMDRMHQLRPGAFPTIRITTFGGEPVPADLVERWSAAAPGSIIENVYGSTEMSVNTAYYSWDQKRSPGESVGGMVPIGVPLPGVTTLVCNERLEEIPPGEQGELLVHGRLVTAGYLGDAEKTRAAYVTIPGRSGTFFRTGDIVRRPKDGEPLVYIGRRDSQIKVLGNRVELGEIEAVGRTVLGTREVAAFGWPPSPRGFDAIEVFVGDTTATEQQVHRSLREHLPAYMVPRRVRILERLPLNPSGKIDRIALRGILEKEQP